MCTPRDVFWAIALCSTNISILIWWPLLRKLQIQRTNVSYLSSTFKHVILIYFISVHITAVLNLYLIDVVSGSVIFSMTHRKVRPPLHIVHSENWLAYSYFNDKVRRTEISE